MTASAEKTNRSTHSERRQQIVATAREILAEKGPAALTLRHVADEVGIKLASLQYHIPTKAALMEALAADIVEHYDLHLEGITRQANLEPEETLAELIRWIRSPKSGEWRLIHRLEIQFWAMALVEPAVTEAQVEFFSGYRALLADLIKHINPRLTRQERIQRAGLMSVMIDGCSLIQSDHLPPDPALSGLTDELVTTALELARRPPSA